MAVHWLHLKTDYAPVGWVMVSLEIMERGTLEFASFFFLFLLPWEYIGAPCAFDPFTFNSKLPPPSFAAGCVMKKTGRMYR